MSDNLKYHLFLLTPQRVDVTGQTQQMGQSVLNSKEIQNFPKKIWYTKILSSEAEQFLSGARGGGRDGREV